MKYLFQNTEVYELQFRAINRNLMNKLKIKKNLMLNTNKHTYECSNAPGVK